MDVISCRQARAEGKTHYFTGKPCKHGHTTKRYVGNRKCAGCSRIEDGRRYSRNPEKEKARSREHGRRKLPTPTRPCPDRCELCGGPSGARTFHLDHDHKTGKFRGWLCGSCNTTLGKFGDDVGGLQRAIMYLRRNTAQGGLPTDPQERKQVPVASGFLDYFPRAVCAVAHVSYVGNEQHNPGQPLRWDRSKSSDEADALLRHFSQRGTLDSDGLRHSAKVAWRAMALLQKELEKEGQS